MAKRIVDLPAVSGTLSDAALFEVSDSGTSKKATLAQVKAGAVTSIVAGDGITIDDTDPQNPIISSDSGEAILASKWTKYTVNVGQFTPIDQFQADFTFGTIPANTLVEAVLIQCTTAFDDAGSHGYQVSILVPNSYGVAAPYHPGQTVHTGAVANGVEGKVYHQNVDVASKTVSTPLKARLVSLSNIVDLTVGAADIWVKTVTFP